MADSDIKTKRFSVKKTIGSIGAVCLHLIALYAVYKDPSQAGVVLWPLATFDAALFGIKTFGGVAGSRNGQVRP